MPFSFSLSFQAFFLSVNILSHVYIYPAEGALGGELAYFKTPQMTPNVTHRQNVCDRFQAFQRGDVELKDALEGYQLNVLMAAYQDGYFNYDNTTGIDATYPGLQAVILDELARRGKFTWRESFGISDAPSDGDWTGLLKWGVEAYDVNADWWAQNLARMNMGIAFLEEWYDSSILLIKKETPEVISDDVNFWNWLKPYNQNVWICTVVTVLLSGLVFQCLEWFDDAREERTMWEWFSQNFYLSAINFTQAYEYQPRSLASRIFGISMAIWALVMTATYTANLASLLVERKPTAIQVESIEEAAAFGYKICTFEGTNSDTHIKTNFQKAQRIPKLSLLEVYQGLNTGECAFAADVVASWNELSKQKKYNPNCDLAWLGGDRLVVENGAGFAVAADSGGLCTGLIRDVLDFHMRALKDDGFLEDAWEREYRRKQDRDCNTWRPELELLEGILQQTAPPAVVASSVAQDDVETRRQRQRKLNNPQTPGDRMLKAGGKGAAGGAVAAAAQESEDKAKKLTLNQMIGTFVFHWFMMFIAIVIAISKYYYGKHAKNRVDQMTAQVAETVSQQFKISFQKDSSSNDSEKEDATAAMQLGVPETSNICDRDSNNGHNNESDKKLQQMQEQLEAMQQSQQQLLNEQRTLQQQIRLLVDEVNVKC